MSHLYEPYLSLHDMADGCEARQYYDEGTYNCDVTLAHHMNETPHARPRQHHLVLISREAI